VQTLSPRGPVCMEARADARRLIRRSEAEQTFVRIADCATHEYRVTCTLAEHMAIEHEPGVRFASVLVGCSAHDGTQSDFEDNHRRRSQQKSSVPRQAYMVMLRARA